MEEDLKRLEELIKPVHSNWIGISNQKALENLLTRYKDIKRINSDLQGEQEQLYNKIDKLEEKNEEWQRAYQEEKDKQFELLRENKELKEDNEQLEVIKDEAIRRYNFEAIPVSKIIELMEELKTKPLKINENDKYYYETEVYNKIVIQVLQELLES